jgi:hypothetical protein
MMPKPMNEDELEYVEKQIYFNNYLIYQDLLIIVVRSLRKHEN